MLHALLACETQDSLCSNGYWQKLVLAAIIALTVKVMAHNANTVTMLRTGQAGFQTPKDPHCIR